MIKSAFNGKTQKVICDVCGKQIVSGEVSKDDKYTTGPLNKTVMLCANQHCCINCYPSYNEYMEMIEGIDSDVDSYKNLFGLF